MGPVLKHFIRLLKCICFLTHKCNCKTKSEQFHLPTCTVQDTDALSRKIRREHNFIVVKRVSNEVKDNLHLVTRLKMRVT